MDDGAVLAATSGHNRQAACGDDVINRIICAEKDGVKKLSSVVLSTINGLISEALESANAHQDQIENVAISGNTTMSHLLLKIEPHNIRREPLGTRKKIIVPRALVFRLILFDHKFQKAKE